MIQQSYEKKREYQERARARQLEKMQSKEYKDKQLVKAKAAQERQIEKAKAKAKEAPKKPYSSSLVTRKPLVAKKPMKNKGMAGKTRTKIEMSLHDKMARLGCIACINKGLIQPFSGSPVSIHHIDGRTKEDAHKKAIPLCGWHHDVPIEKSSEHYGKYPFVFPLHAKGSEGGKVQWEAENGDQYDLLKQVLGLIGES